MLEVWGMGGQEWITVSFDRSPLSKDPFFLRYLRQLPELKAPELPERLRNVARRAWEERARTNYVGVQFVRRVHAMLSELHAPGDLLELALIICTHKQQHVELCITAAESFGGDGTLSFELSDLEPSQPGQTTIDGVMHELTGTYALSEIVRLALLERTLDDLTPSDYRNLVLYMARDAVLHARFIHGVLGHIREGAEWMPYPGDAWVRASVDRSRRRLRRWSVADPAEVRLFQHAQYVDLLRSVGVPDPSEIQACYFTSLDHDVDKALEKAGLPPEQEESTV